MSDAASPEPRSTALPRTPGPRTDAGRRRSRLNARIHGLTAKLPDGAEEAALMQQFADHWADRLGPETEAEEALIRASAVAYSRFERARKVEEATLRTASQEAVDRWERKKRHAVRRKAQELARDPYNTVADLEANSFGCEWLMRQWLRLDALLAQGLGWDYKDLPMAMQLLGYQPKPPGPDGDPAARRIWFLALLASGHAVAPQPGLPADPVPARLDLRRLVAAELDRLDALRNELWGRQDGPEAEAVAQAGIIDTSKDGQLRQRYRREAFSEMVRGINQVTRLQSGRRKAGEPRPLLPLPGSLRPRPAVEGHQDVPAGPPEVPAAPPVPPPAPSPSTVEVGHRNEPPREAENTLRVRRKSNDENSLRDEALEAAPRADRRTEPTFPSAWGPAEAHRDGEPSPMGDPMGLRWPATPAVAAG